MHNLQNPTHSKFTVTACVLPGDVAEFDEPVDVEFDPEFGEVLQAMKDGGQAINAVARFNRCLSNERLREILTDITDTHRKSARHCRMRISTHEIDIMQRVANMSVPGFVALIAQVRNECPKVCGDFYEAARVLRHGNVQWEEVDQGKLADLADNDYDANKAKSPKEVPEIGGERVG